MRSYTTFNRRKAFIIVHRKVKQYIFLFSKPHTEGNDKSMWVYEGKMNFFFFFGGGQNYQVALYYNYSYRSLYSSMFNKFCEIYTSNKIKKISITVKPMYLCKGRNCTEITIFDEKNL
jgi:hypothetical protein